MTIRCSPGHHPKCPKQQFQRTDWPPIELTQHSKMSLPLKLAFSQDLRFQSTFNFFFNLGDHRSCRPLSEFRKAEVDISYSVPVGCVTPYVVMKPPLEEAQDTPNALPLFCTHPKETLLFCNIIRVLGPAVIKGMITVCVLLLLILRVFWPLTKLFCFNAQCVKLWNP